MYYKVIAEMTAAEKASFLFREEEVVDLGVIAEMSKQEQFVLLTEVLHTHPHQTNKKIMSYMAKLCCRLSYYDTAIMYDLKSLKGQNSAEFKMNTYWHIASTFLAKDDLSLAIDYYKKALVFSPKNPELLSLLAKTFYKIKKNESGIRYFKKAIKYDPQNTALYGQLGFAYLRKHDYRRAINAFKRSLILNPADQRSCYGLGLAFFEDGNYNEAGRAFNICVKNNWLLDKALLGLALISLGRDDLKKAGHYFTEVNLVNPHTVLVENVPLAETVSKHAVEQAKTRNVDLEKVISFKNIGISGKREIRVYPYSEAGHWSGYEIIYNPANRTMVTVINYKIRHNIIVKTQNFLRDFFKKISFKLPGTAGGSAQR